MVSTAKKNKKRKSYKSGFWLEFETFYADWAIKKKYISVHNLLKNAWNALYEIRNDCWKPHLLRCKMFNAKYVMIHWRMCWFPCRFSHPEFRSFCYSIFNCSFLTHLHIYCDVINMISSCKPEEQNTHSKQKRSHRWERLFKNERYQYTKRYRWQF